MLPIDRDALKKMKKTAQVVLMTGIVLELLTSYSIVPFSSLRPAIILIVAGVCFVETCDRFLTTKLV